MSYPKGKPRTDRPFRFKVLDFIQHYQYITGMSPTQKEIAGGTGISSTGTVWRALEQLVIEGYITRVRTQVKIRRMP